MDMVANGIPADRRHVSVAASGERRQRNGNIPLQYQDIQPWQGRVSSCKSGVPGSGSYQERI